MSDYSPKMVNEIDVRNFVTPPLDYDDISKAEVLLKIESVEQYISTVYSNVTGNAARIAALLLIIAKIIQVPNLANKYYTLSYEKLGDYAYNLAQPISRGTDVQSSPFVISKTYEKMAIEILEKASLSTKYYFKVVND